VQTTKPEDVVQYKGPPQITPNPPPPPAPKGPPTITRPDWIRLPDTSDLDRYYPPAAKERGTEGRATQDCVVTVSGTLRECRVVSETPAGQGFGAASIKISSRFKMRPQTSDGQPVGGAHVAVPIRWTLTGG